MLAELADPLLERGVDPSRVGDDFDLLTSGMIDSLGILELIEAVNEHFGIDDRLRGARPRGPHRRRAVLRVRRPDGDRRPAMTLTVRSATGADVERLAAIHVDGYEDAYRGLVPDEVLDTRTSSCARGPGASASRPGRSDEFVFVAEAATARSRASSRGRAATRRRGRPRRPHRLLGEPLPASRVVGSSGGFRLALELERGTRAALTERGFTEAVNFVIEGNERARRFFEAVGWHPDGTLAARSRAIVQHRVVARSRSRQRHSEAGDDTMRADPRAPSSASTARRSGRRSSASSTSEIAAEPDGGLARILDRVRRDRGGGRRPARARAPFVAAGETVELPLGGSYGAGTGRSSSTRSRLRAQDDTDLIVEMGSGWGWHILTLWASRRAARRDLRRGRVHRGRAARAERLAGLDERLAFRAVAFDYHEPRLGGLGAREPRGRLLGALDRADPARAPRAVRRHPRRRRTRDRPPLRAGRLADRRRHDGARHHRRLRRRARLQPQPRRVRPRRGGTPAGITIDHIAADVFGIMPHNSTRSSCTLAETPDVTLVAEIDAQAAPRRRSGSSALANARTLPQAVVLSSFNVDLLPPFLVEALDRRGCGDRRAAAPTSARSPSELTRPRRRGRRGCRRARRARTCSRRCRRRRRRADERPALDELCERESSTRARAAAQRRRLSSSPSARHALARRPRARPGRRAPRPARGRALRRRRPRARRAVAARGRRRLGLARALGRRRARFRDDRLWYLGRMRLTPPGLAALADWSPRYVAALPRRARARWSPSTSTTRSGAASSARPAPRASTSATRASALAFQDFQRELLKLRATRRAARRRIEEQPRGRRRGLRAPPRHGADARALRRRADQLAGQGHEPAASGRGARPRPRLVRLPRRQPGRARVGRARRCPRSRCRSCPPTRPSARASCASCPASPRSRLTDADAQRAAPTRPRRGRSAAPVGRLVRGLPALARAGRDDRAGRRRVARPRRAALPAHEPVQPDDAPPHGRRHRGDDRRRRATSCTRSRCSDRFDDSGITGVAIVRLRRGRGGDRHVPAVSCRVLGRRVEDALLAVLANRARARGARTLRRACASRPPRTRRPRPSTPIAASAEAGDGVVPSLSWARTPAQPRRDAN